MSALAYVRRHPGATCAEVAAYLRVPCLVAGAYLRSLRAAGSVTSRGNTRGTRYYPRKGAR